MRFLISIIAVTFMAYALGFYLAVPANPEVKFWREVVERREREIKQTRLSEPDTPIIFFTGGSSTAFSVDPKIIEETCGLPAFNLGLPVAAGGEYLIHQALEMSRPGDLVVLGLEPDILASPSPDHSPSKFSFAIAAVSGHVTDAAGGKTFGDVPSFPDYLNLARPGAGYLSTFLARIVRSKDYRYNLSDIRYRGRIETQMRAAKPAESRRSFKISPYGRDLLKMANTAAHSRGVRLVYAMPWHLTSSQGVESSRIAQSKLNQEIQSIIPVADDGFSGVSDNPDWFSDSAQHLTKEGSKIRSQALAVALLKYSKPLKHQNSKKPQS